MYAFLDSRGILIEPGASVYTIIRSGHSPCEASHLWRVEKTWGGNLELVPRPYQPLPAVQLTDEASRFLVVIDEIETFIPESHPELWQEFLREGWEIHAGLLPVKNDQIFSVGGQDFIYDEPMLTFYIRNKYNNHREQFTLPGIHKNKPINTGGLSEHEFAARAWSFYLTQARSLNRAFQNHF